MKIRLVGTELFHADRWTDMTTLIVAFRNFANAPKNVATKRKIYYRNTKISSLVICIYTKVFTKRYSVLCTSLQRLVILRMRSVGLSESKLFVKAVI
jgi:hypothetical protein